MPSRFTLTTSVAYLLVYNRLLIVWRRCRDTKHSVHCYESHVVIVIPRDSVNLQAKLQGQGLDVVSSLSRSGWNPNPWQFLPVFRHFSAMVAHSMLQTRVYSQFLCQEINRIFRLRQYSTFLHLIFRSLFRISYRDTLAIRFSRTPTCDRRTDRHATTANTRAS